ncbi:MAG: protoheme IX farnesyltransferase [Bradymonadaceae bacterium]|nr:protoheme IX farnesyltransferase [Lujinxingiaceae bacterium]
MSSSEPLSSLPPTGASASFGNASPLRRAFAKAGEFNQLTKPGIIRLLVLTTVCTMLVAEGGVPELGLMFWTVLGTAMICGSANTINMVWDQDIDKIMARTSHRPLVTGAITPVQALVFAGVMGLGAVLILTYFANPLAAMMGIAGHAFYVVIYTMWLKRRTPQNIVIGGAAGAFPPLIGWAAVTGDLGVTPWLIFAVIFFWTPPHFWALALYKDIEYGKAGVPMMPVVRGKRTTKLQMLVYMLLLLGVTMLLGITGDMGIIYLVAAVVLGAGFTYCCIRTAFDASDYWPKRTFAYSILYLALLFGAMSADSLYPQHFTEGHYLSAIERDAAKYRAKQTQEELRELHSPGRAVHP